METQLEIGAACLLLLVMAFLSTVDAAFGQRRKMLRSALTGLAGSSAAAGAAVGAAGLDPKARGETLDVTDFTRIAEQIFQA